LVAENDIRPILLQKYMNDVDKRNFKRNIASLNDIYEFITSYFAKSDIAESNSFSVSLAIEEIFVNMVKYQRESQDDITIELKLERNKLIIILTGYNVEYFDISNVPNIDTKAPLGERKIGRLGLLLTNKLMDKIDYDYNERTCRVILTKTLEE